MKKRDFFCAATVFAWLATGALATPPVAKRIGEMPATTGAVKVPVVLVEFQDVAMSELSPGDGYRARLTGTATQTEVEQGLGTAEQYFADQSHGLFRPEFVVIGPVRLDGTRAYYGADGLGTDSNVGVMIAEAIRKAVDSGEVEDWTVFDSDKDGVVDALYVIYAGEGQHAIPTQTDLIWPHTATLSGRDYETPVLDNGLTFNSYSCTNELLYGELDGIGTFCHEFSHQLGLPDFYRTDGVTMSNFAMGSWSIMDYGSYAMGGKRPVGMRALERIALGWEEPIVLGEATTVDGWPSMAEGGAPLKIVNGSQSTEYYLLETIDGRGWDMSCPAQGMLVTHVYLSAENPMRAAEWRNNTVNNNAPLRVTIVPADNEKPLLVTGVNDEEYLENLTGDTYPSPAGNNELTDSSTPSFGSYVGWGTIGKPVTDITYDAASGCVSFQFMGGSEDNVLTSVGGVKAAVAGQGEAYYRLDGTRADDMSRRGVYVRVRPDGSIVKVLQ